jgi:thiamine-monophosphate kinase
MTTVADLGERALIARLFAATGPAPAHVAIGIGDDAAVIEPPRGGLDVLTTDSFVEDVHFRRGWCAPADIGHKALAVNLSDLAAMGAEPRAVLLSLILPDALPIVDFDGIIEGFLALARRARAPLVGGNIARSPGPLILDVTAVGAARRRRVLTRSGGRPGHELWVTGRLGLGAAGLRLLERDASLGPDGGTAESPPSDEGVAECLERYRRPEPRLRTGLLAARSRSVSACIDLSDGLAAAARQLSEASGTGVVLEAQAIPTCPTAERLSRDSGGSGTELALNGGDDYELLFAVSPRRRRSFLAATGSDRGSGVTRVGRLVTEAGAWLEEGDSRTPLSSGFEHFQLR